MIEPQIPEDEKARLETLRTLKLLDTEPEERFDRLTRLARRMFGVPISLVSLVDGDRQWFKSRQGLDLTETPRDISFCGHAILQDDAFVVENALKDERFFDNPLVTDDPSIRFYAGHPLKVAQGGKMGTLCLIDSEPREFSEEDQQLLKDLAVMAEAEIKAIQIASMDELTEISNRRGFMALAKHSLALCQRLEKQAFMLMFDLDDFKPINDRFGHAEGDRALIAFANIMRDIFRESDVFARTGGDEFMAFLGNCDRSGAHEVLQRLRESLDQFNTTEGRGYNLGYSVGCLPVNPDDPYSIEDLMEQADQLMYKNKQNKPNR
jgi:diguanylate cyclase (GGDEF)-like protein